MVTEGNGRRDILKPLGDGAEAGFGVSPCSCSSGDELRPPRQNTRLKNIGCRDPGIVGWLWIGFPAFCSSHSTSSSPDSSAHVLPPLSQQGKGRRQSLLDFLPDSWETWKNHRVLLHFKPTQVFLATSLYVLSKEVPNSQNVSWAQSSQQKGQEIFNLILFFKALIPDCDKWLSAPSSRTTSFLFLFFQPFRAVFQPPPPQPLPKKHRGSRTKRNSLFEGLIRGGRNGAKSQNQFPAAERGLVVVHKKEK